MTETMYAGVMRRVIDIGRRDDVDARDYPTQRVGLAQIPVVAPGNALMILQKSETSSADARGVI